MKSTYISYHCFNWILGRILFVKSIIKVGGEILEIKKENGKHLVKVSNPISNMQKHKNWYNSNNKFFNKQFKPF